MRLEILLPFGPFARIEAVTRIVVVTLAGSFGLLPHRRDCAAVLTPGLLTYGTASGDTYVAVDEGVLTKTGDDVRVCVRHAIAGVGLGELQQAVEREFRDISAQEKAARIAMLQMETGLLRRWRDLRHG